MNYKDLKFEGSYTSVGELTLSDFFNVALKNTKLYQRSVGFFSSSAFDFISEGILNLAQNGGKIQIACSPLLSEKDINAISEGYAKRDIYEKAFVTEFKSQLEDLDDDNLNLLSELIAENVLDIKIVYKPNGGIYHDKLAVLTDFDNNKIVAVGSPNESKNGYEENYEKVRIFKSWVNIHGVTYDIDVDNRILDETKEFSTIWDNSNSFLEVYEFKEAIDKTILEVKQNIAKNNSSKPVYDLRKYQTDAIDAWVQNKYKGFYVMATGTGKTVTALYSIKRLLEVTELFTVITVPYIHLVQQWYEDAVKIFTDSTIIKAYGASSSWYSELVNSIYYNKFTDKKKNIIVIITMKSFCADKFNDLLSNVDSKKLLVVDEAHNFIRKLESKYQYDYMLGLSATPNFGQLQELTDKLLNFFGGLVYSLPIENAIGKFLVNYEYYPIFAKLSEEEAKNFNKLSGVMASCFTDGTLTDVNKFVTAHSARLRVLSMAEDKINNIPKYIKKINTDDHFIVYCSDGKLSTDDDNIRHLEYVLKLLNKEGYYPSKFTADESMDTRIRLINKFNDGIISTLVAIRCLDEGINIPSIETALILSSNDNYREFVQRRGRILRKFKNKQKAKIYDVIVLPDEQYRDIAQIELRRYYEYAKLALNKKHLLEELNKLLCRYSLDLDDIMFNLNDTSDEAIEGDKLDD